MKLNSKTVVVTGGAKGIGRELTLQLLGKGARVAVVDMDEKALEKTRELSGKQKDRLSLHNVNISDREAVEQLPDAVIAAHGAVDAIINNAGIIQPFVKINALDYTAIEKVMKVNFYGSLYMIKAFLPHLLKRPTAHIANISSMGGFLPVPGQSIYGASKAAVKLMTEALYSELKNTNVKVSIVFPGGVGTNIAANSGIEVPAMNSNGKKYKMLEPAKAAEIIVKGIENDKFRILVGSDSRFMDFIYRLSPKYATDLISKQMKSLLRD
jgi:short-subunit dehydrogenase